VSRCKLSPYETCLATCKQQGTEQQAGGAEGLALIARSTCEQLKVAMQQSTTSPQATTTPQQPASTAVGEIDVDFDVPPGYAASSYQGMTVLSPTSGDAKTPCTYGLSGARASSGSLEKDAFAALLEPLPGWQRKGDSYNAMRGTSATGWPYYWIRTDAQRPGQTYQYASVMAMAFPSADRRRTNIVWGYGGPAQCLLDDASFARLFHSLRPRGWTSDGGSALARDLEGLWRNSQDHGMTQFRFKTGGRYEFGIHSSVTIGYSERTSTGTHDGNYSLRDGLLVIKPDRKTRGVENLRVRIYDEYTLGRWTRALSTLDERGDAAREVQYYRIDESK
jgi:hypothetical protein